MKRGIAVVIMMMVLVGCEKAPVKKSENTSVPPAAREAATQRIQQVILDLENKIKDDPKNVDAYLALGEVFIRMNEIAKASQLLTTAVSVDPTKANSFYMLAVCKGMEGQFEEAIVIAKKGGELFMQQKNQEGFQRTVALIQNLTRQLSKKAATQ